MSLLVCATTEEIEKGRAITVSVAETVGDRRFVLVVDNEEPGEVGDIYSNMVAEGGDPIELLENALAALKACRDATRRK